MFHVLTTYEYKLLLSGNQTYLPLHSSAQTSQHTAGQTQETAIAELLTLKENHMRLRRSRAAILTDVWVEQIVHCFNSTQMV